MTPYEPGQRWTYRTREYDAGSTLVIGKIDKRPVGQPILHVTVLGVNPHAGADSVDIAHMPFSQKAIDDSVLALVETNVGVGPRFHEGFDIWSADQGGIFDIPVAQAVDGVLSIAMHRETDPFDAIVTKMRAEKSKARISELYRLLFSIDHWFFLCHPNNPRMPVQWVFPDGLNKTPALLAFTSSGRAVSAAVKLGIYPSGSEVRVMPASVKEAVAWITGPECRNSWVCFNLTYQNFPLYCDDAVRLLREL
jgi:hypothetical protein